MNFHVRRYLSSEYTEQANMELYERIAIFAIICTGLCSAVDPDWSCDFEEDTCGIITETGNWIIDATNGRGTLRADVSRSSRSGDMFIFSIPHNFTSPRGNLSFEYFLAGAGSSMSVKVCMEASVPEFTVGYVGPPAEETKVVPYSCASTMNVEITFNATRGGVAPTIRVDNITIYETPYTDLTTAVSLGTMVTILTVPTVTTPSSTEPITTISSSETNVPFSTKGISTISIEATTTPQSAGSMPWTIPVTSALVVFFVVILVVLFVLFCYRRRNQATKPKEKVVPRNGALTSRAGDSEVRYSYPKLPAYSECYSEIREDQQPLKVVTIGGNGKTKGNVGPHDNQGPNLSAAAGFKVKNSDSAVCSNLVKNPVYEGRDLIPTRGQGDSIDSLISSPLYEEALDNEPQSAPPDDLIDNPLYGDKMDKLDGQVHNGLPGPPPTGDLIDNPLYAGQNERPTGQGFSTQPEAVTPDGLVDNPLYGDQSSKLGDDGFSTQQGSAATDELIDNPLYGDQSGKSDGQESSGLPGLPPNDDLIDNPLYGDGCDGPVGQGLNDQTELVPTGELIDNPLYGGQNERSGHGFSTQEEPAPPDDLVDNSLYGGQSEKFHGY